MRRAEVAAAHAGPNVGAVDSAAVTRFATLLVAAVLSVVLGGCDGDGDSTDTVVTTSSTEGTTTSATAPASTAPPNTATLAISRAEAQAAAQEAASRAIEGMGISYEPGDFAVRCENSRGLDEAPTWTCEVDSGQCTGTVEIIAAEDGGTESRNEQVGCGE